MSFTFECGVCRSVYRLDEKQITPNGVKITCPKCLNFFLLKRGETEGTEAAVVEYIVQDGAYDLSHSVATNPGEPAIPPPLPPKETAAPRPSPPDEPSKEKKKKWWESVSGEFLNPFYPPKVKSKLTEADLSEYPQDASPKSVTDHYFWYVALIFLVIVTLLALNFEGVLPIPGLANFRHQAEVVQEPAITPTVTGSPTSKHGFPKVDTTYDPWAGAPALPTPVPEPEKKK